MIQLFTDQAMLQTVNHQENAQAEQFRISTIPNKSDESRMTPIGMLHFSSKKWEHLTDLIIQNTTRFQPMVIGAKGCKYLSRTPLPKIKTIVLCAQRTNVAGICHLSKAPWRTLKEIKLRSNQVGTGCVQMLIRADWQNIRYIDLCIECQYEAFSSIGGPQFETFLLGEHQKLDVIISDFQFKYIRDCAIEKMKKKFKPKKYHLRSLT